MFLKINFELVRSVQLHLCASVELILGQQELMFRFSGSAVVWLNTTLINVRRGITLSISNYKMISQVFDAQSLNSGYGPYSSSDWLIM